jgi:hypothetical protein
MVGTPPDAFASGVFAHPTDYTPMVPENPDKKNHRKQMLDMPSTV